MVKRAIDKQTKEYLETEKGQNQTQIDEIMKNATLKREAEYNMTQKWLTKEWLTKDPNDTNDVSLFDMVSSVSNKHPVNCNLMELLFCTSFSLFYHHFHPKLVLCFLLE